MQITKTKSGVQVELSEEQFKDLAHLLGLMNKDDFTDFMGDSTNNILVIRKSILEFLKDK